MYSKIDGIKARQVLDSRGNPTVEAEVWCGERVGRAIAPSGASTGSFEAHELRDGDPARYNGKSVERAVSFVNTEIRDRLIYHDVTNQKAIDRMLCEADGTENKVRYGANAILAVSLAAAKCAAAAVGIPLYRYVGGCGATRMPVPMLNVINGGKHSDNGLDIQEFMIIPKSDEFPRMLESSVSVYNALKLLLSDRGLSVSLGDEGGFAPQINSNEEALELLMQAIIKAGYVPGEDFNIGLDVASTEFYIETNDATYRMPKSNVMFTPEQLADYYTDLTKRFPITSIEDPFAEEDWESWKNFTKQTNATLVGDDLFVTNAKRLKKGITEGVANAILIKPNQIGTLTETLECIEKAKKAGYKTIISHRSGETEDTSIADIAVAVSADMIKCGAPARGERTAKYNRLLAVYGEIK